MTAPAAELSADLRCHRCGYDLRAHPPDAKCPECGTSVAESRLMAATPIRPRWRDSDPRWRRRMLAGVWILALLPLMDVLSALGWGGDLPVPNLWGYGAVRTLSDTFIWPPNWSYILNIWAPLAFCIGVVLLFSKERGRRRNWLDRSRPWGVFLSYIVFALNAVQALFIPALVLVGIAAVFQSMPLKFQPRVTQLCVDLSTGWLRYGLQPNNAVIMLAGFSSIAILLACIPLFDALRSSGPERPARILLAPLALFALFNLAQTARYILFMSLPASSIYSYSIYFSPELLVGYIAPPPPPFSLAGATLGAFLVEAIKWCIILAIAVWLSVAQLAGRGKKRKKGLRPEC